MGAGECLVASKRKAGRRNEGKLKKKGKGREICGVTRNCRKKKMTSTNTDTGTY